MPSILDPENGLAVTLNQVGQGLLRKSGALASGCEGMVHSHVCNTGRHAPQMFSVAPGVTTVTERFAIIGGMVEQLYRKTYIKEWREKRGLSLRRLADRLEQTPGGDLMISHTSIARIEKGQQPYSQPILEAIANALGVTASMLLEVNPEKDGDVIDITLRLNKAPPELRKQAIDILEALLKSVGPSR